MPVIVTNEAEDLGPHDCFDGPPEVCLLCGQLTRNWWGVGCFPLCQACADLDSTTHIKMVEVAEKGLFGPIPTENTDR